MSVKGEHCFIVVYEENVLQVDAVFFKHTAYRLYLPCELFLVCVVIITVVSYCNHEVTLSVIRGELVKMGNEDVRIIRLLSVEMDLI